LKPSVVILDPINAFVTDDNQTEVKNYVVAFGGLPEDENAAQLSLQVLLPQVKNMEISDVYISSLIDTWLLLRDIENWG
jgi:circadian clock protein KaiC